MKSIVWTTLCHPVLLMNERTRKGYLWGNKFVTNNGRKNSTKKTSTPNTIILFLVRSVEKGTTIGYPNIHLSVWTAFTAPIVSFSLKSLCLYFNHLLLNFPARIIWNKNSSNNFIYVVSQLVKLYTILFVNNITKKWMLQLYLLLVTNNVYTFWFARTYFILLLHYCVQYISLQ